MRIFSIDSPSRKNHQKLSLNSGTNFKTFLPNIDKLNLLNYHNKIWLFNPGDNSKTIITIK